MNALEKVHNLLRHIHNVQANCIHLGEKLITRGEEQIGIRLIRNGLQHDATKFDGIEWELLDLADHPNHYLAVFEHQKHNRHHPEFHVNIHDMCDVDVAEMVCDWKARSGEFGTGLKEWIEVKATAKWQFKMTDPIGRKIKKYMKLLLDKPFV